MSQVESKGNGTVCKVRRSLMNITSDCPESFGPMKYCIHCGHIGQQRLCCTNVRRGFIASDMLLTSL